MSRAALIAMVGAALAAGCVTGCLKGGLGHPQASFKLGYGNALNAAGTSRGTSASIVYRDHGGILTRTALAPFRFLGAPQSPWKSACSLNATGSSMGCTWWLTQEAADKYDVDVAAWRTNLMTGKSSAETTLEVASRSLGGDTRGFRFSLDYPLVKDSRVMIKAGVGFGGFTTYGRTTRGLTGEATSVYVTELTADAKSSHLTVPLTVLVVLPRNLVASYRLEWNLLRYDLISVGAGDYHPQLSRFGLERMLLPSVRLGVELQIDGVRARSATGSVELGLAF